jgi:hypothetical protein
VTYLTVVLGRSGCCYSPGVRLFVYCFLAPRGRAAWNACRINCRMTVASLSPTFSASARNMARSSALTRICRRSSFGWGANVHPLYCHGVFGQAPLRRPQTPTATTVTKTASQASCATGRCEGVPLDRARKVSWPTDPRSGRVAPKGSRSEKGRAAKRVAQRKGSRREMRGPSADWQLQ